MREKHVLSTRVGYDLYMRTHWYCCTRQSMDPEETFCGILHLFEEPNSHFIDQHTNNPYGTSVLGSAVYRQIESTNAEASGRLWVPGYDWFKKLYSQIAIFELGGQLNCSF